jgi:transposase
MVVYHRFMGNPRCPDCLELIAYIEQLERRLKELEDRSSKNSRNSSKPPSSDGLGKPKPQSLREKSGRSPGGQNGHKGKALEMKKDPDKVIMHITECCEECGSSLKGAPVVGVERRQVFDLPPISLKLSSIRQSRRNARTVAA